MHEISVILHAGNKTRPRYTFTILGYDGKRYEFADREVRLIVAKLADFFNHQLLLSVLRDCRNQLPNIVIADEIKIPE